MSFLSSFSSFSCSNVVLVYYYERTSTEKNMTSKKGSRTNSTVVLVHSVTPNWHVIYFYSSPLFRTYTTLAHRCIYTLTYTQAVCSTSTTINSYTRRIALKIWTAFQWLFLKEERVQPKACRATHDTYVCSLHTWMIDSLPQSFTQLSTHSRAIGRLRNSRTLKKKSTWPFWTTRPKTAKHTQSEMTIFGGAKCARVMWPNPKNAFVSLHDPLFGHGRYVSI